MGPCGHLQVHIHMSSNKTKLRVKSVLVITERRNYVRSIVDVANDIKWKWLEKVLQNEVRRLTCSTTESVQLCYTNHNVVGIVHVCIVQVVLVMVDNLISAHYSIIIKTTVASGSKLPVP